MVCEDVQPLEALAARGWTVIDDESVLPAATPWTDDYSSLLVPLWHEQWE